MPDAAYHETQSSAMCRFERQANVPSKGALPKRKLPRMGMPDFYNITLERPKEDPAGYDLIYVEVSEKSLNRVVFQGLRIHGFGLHLFRVSWFRVLLKSEEDLQTMTLSMLRWVRTI